MIWLNPSPPGEVSLPRAFRPLAVERVGTALRISWEDQGATSGAYNLYEGTLGGSPIPAARLCHVAGTSDGAGGRYIDLDPAPAGNVYYLVSASDACAVEQGQHVATQVIDRERPRRSRGRTVSPRVVA